MKEPVHIPEDPETLRDIVNIPNTLTLARAWVVGYVSYILATKGPSLETWAIYALGMCTDWLDGKIARTWNLQTRFGKRLDPMVDSMAFHFPLWALIYGTNDSVHQIIYAASSSLIALRDADLFRRSIQMERHGEIFDVSKLGKVKTGIQMAAVSILVATPEIYPAVQEFGRWMLGGGAFFSLASWVDYYQRLKTKGEELLF